MSRREVHLVGGTLPEAVRLAPVALAVRAAGLLEPVLLAGGPQLAPVTKAFTAFGLRPEITFPAGSLTEMIRELDELWSVRTPAAVIVAGDTSTSLAGALAAFWRRIPVVHLEAGRRSGDLASPSLQEGNRRLLAQVTTVHLTTTPMAAMNLLDEKLPSRDVLVVGSTVAGDPDGDGLAAGRAAQATAALLGLAATPEPMPVSPSSTTTYGVVA